MAKGIYTPAEIVHHKTELTPENIDDPKISMGFDNLKAVCRDCHAQEHNIIQKRYSIGPDGSVKIKNI